MSAPARYSGLAQALHWVTAILVLVAFTYGPGGSEQRVYSAAGDFDRSLHETLGLCVFAISIVRLVWRAFDPQPEPPSGLSPWMIVSAKAVQALLYVLLLALPLTAITGAWLEGHPLTLLGGVRIAPLLGEYHGIGSSAASIHGWLGDAILWLAGLHAAAALYHHFVLRDGVLLSMLPARRRTG